MESLLGFNENAVERSRGYKLMPWLRWDEWDSVRESLFSSSPDSVSSALQRIMAWRSRGCLPVVIEVTASIIEIQQKDRFFRIDLGDNASESEEMLAMLYCMAIMRLVNGVVEKTRKKTEVSIAEAADALNIPRMLIDIRHEGSHRDLPSLRLVRLASIKALDWLKSYYWVPQQKAIPFHSDGTACLGKEIKSRLCELAFYLKIRQPTSSSSSLAKGIKHCEPFCGRNKFLSLMPRRAQHSKFAGSRKQINLALKHIVQLYSSYSLEVVSVLAELLLKESDHLDVTGLSEYYEVRHDTNHVQSVFDDWKPLISKLSNKEPQLLLTLIKAVLEMIETQEALKYGSDNIGSLLFLFEWLVRTLKGLKPVGGEDTAAVTEGSSKGICLPKATLVELLRKTLLLSCPGNNQLRNSALVLAQMIENSFLVEKLSKLYLLWESSSVIDDENCSIISSDSILAQQEDSIHQAAEKLELVKRCRMKSNMLKTTDGGVGNNSRWVVPKSWNSCPIGMLPCDVGSSGRLPVLDLPVLGRNDVDDDDDDNSNNNNAEVPNPLESKRQRALEGGIHKRGPECDVEALDESRVKKMRDTEDARESDGQDDDIILSEGVKGQLMIGGVWKQVGEEDLLAIASAVRILV